MHIEQYYYSEENQWMLVGDAKLNGRADVVLTFGNRYLVEQPRFYEDLRRMYPEGHIIMGSTSGEIVGTEVSEQRIVATAIRFERTQLRVAHIDVRSVADSYTAGATLAQALNDAKLAHVFVVSDGQDVNGTALARGFNDNLPTGTLLTGGLAGDGPRFEKTVVGFDAAPTEGQIVALGFYGDHLQVGFGSSGGWAPFGPMRKITRSDANILYEVDGKSALDLYKKYLGEQAELLPSAALRFPLCITNADRQRTLVRTILSIDEETQGMIFAGDVPEGAHVRFMRASYQDLVDGAEHAAEQSLWTGIEDPDLALCVSCVGRKIVLGQRAEEETEIVREALGGAPVIAGFYSYGELAPPESAELCELHNQTMTITVMKELV